MHHPQTCCCICSQSQTRCTVSECARRQSFLPNTCQTWPSTTTHPNTHQKHNNSRHCQQHHETTTIMFNGIATLLVTLVGKTQRYFKFYYQPGLENLGDYPSKHHTAEVHQHVRPYYVHMDNPPLYFHEPWNQTLVEGVLKSLEILTPRSPHYQA